ncbi:hypothetical protein LCGC14_1464610 [marine sediment metagenome]|uniref:Lysozyme n=1 Tax=marine sediment metagenome TaxID=412755 RepID=A0A0F9JE35_9ZZZZ
MANIDLLKKMLVLDEGKRNTVYPDSQGIMTIGIGRNLEDPGLSDQECYYLLDNDIQRRLVDSRIQSIIKDLDPVRACVIIDMSFMGISKLMGFVHMRGALSIKDFDEAEWQMLNSSKNKGEPSLWARQVGPRATRLAYMMKTGTIHEDYV